MMMSKGCIPSPPKRKVFRFRKSSIVQLDTDVSENSGFSPEIIHGLIGFSIIKHPSILGVFPLFLETPKWKGKPSKKGKQFSFFSTFSGANSQIQTQVGGNEHTSHMFENKLPTIHQSCLTSWICWCHWLSIYSLWQTFCRPLMRSQHEGLWPTLNHMDRFEWTQNPATLRRCGVFFVKFVPHDSGGTRNLGRSLCHMSHI